MKSEDTSTDGGFPRPHAAKMAAVSRLAGGLSHDVGDLVDAAAATIREAIATGPAGKDTLARLQDATASLGRASLIARQLEALSREEPLRPQPQALGERVAELLPLAGRLAGDTITISAGSIDATTWIEADAGQIEQMLFHLVVNARDAMPAGGALDIAVSTHHLDAPRRHRFGELAAGDWCTLTVSDTGHGIDEVVMRRLFEPFFTTKAPGSGSGLGLATVWGNARQIGGQVEVVSGPDLGTTVTVWLPRSEARVDAVEQVATPRAVLVVDDDEWVRAVAVRSLRRAGYGVLQAGDAESALEILADVAGCGVQVVLADIGMPGMSGRMLAATIASRYPGMRLVLMTGRGPEPLAGAEPPVLYKPFSRGELLAAIAG